MKRSRTGAPIMSVSRSVRQPVSCRECRKMKRRCDRNSPCSNCAQRHLECTYQNGSPSTKVSEGSRSDLMSSQPSNLVSVDDAKSLIHPQQMIFNSDILARLNRLENVVFQQQLEAQRPESAIRTPRQNSPCSTPITLHGTYSSTAGTAIPIAAHKIDHDYLIAQLPPLHDANILFKHFEATIHPMLCVLHIPSTRILVLNCYTVLTESRGRPKLEDLLLLFTIFAGAAMAWTERLLVQMQTTKDDIPSTFEKYFNLAMSIVDDSQTALPQNTTAIAAVAVLAQVAINSDDVFPIKALTLRSRCYLMCRAMMIHRLDSPSARKKREKETYSVDRLEVQRRVWWHLVATDWLSSFSGSSQEGCYTILPKFMNVLKPRDVDDLSMGISDFGSRRQADSATDMTFFLERVKLAEICREIVDTLPSVTDDGVEQDYDVVLRLDQKLQNFDNSLPDFCRLKPENTEEFQRICQARPYFNWQRISLLLGLQARICRLHRPYHLESCRNPNYSYSRTASLSSAHKVLELRRIMDEPDTKANFRAERYWAILQHVTTAAITLAVDASFNPGAPDAEASRQNVLAAYETLNRSRRDAQSLIQGIEKNMERVMDALQGHHPYTATRTSPPTELISPSQGVESDNVLADMHESTVLGFGGNTEDVYSHQLWSDFLIAVPDLEEFDWTSLMKDIELEAADFGKVHLHAERS